MTPTSVSISKTDKPIMTISNAVGLIDDNKMGYYCLVKTNLPRDLRHVCLDNLGFELYFESNEISNYEESAAFSNCHTAEPLSFPREMSADSEGSFVFAPPAESRLQCDLNTQELFVHDYIEEGIKVNWKKARNLYKRIKHYESRPVRKSRLGDDDTV